MAKSTVFVLKLWTPIETMRVSSERSQSTKTMEEVVKLELKHLPLIRELLKAYGLPYQDCHEHIDYFVGIFFDENLVAVGGFEHLGNVGLMRSIAVATNQQGKGLATSIVKQLQRNATLLGLKALYLLTETAEHYFLSHGYETIDRDELPTEVTVTKQCQSLCPASAQAMVIHLPVYRP